MTYDIYHDESKEEAFWHIFLFIPHDIKSELTDTLLQARYLCDYKGRQLSFKNLNSNSSLNCTKSWLSILSSAFQQKDKKPYEPFYMGTNTYDSSCSRRTGCYGTFSKPLKCKVAIFHLKDNHKDMSSNLNDLSKLETTFRMGLQGASHYLFSPECPLVVSSIILDGEKHYPIQYNANFDFNKVSHKLDIMFRDYCSLSSTCTISGKNISEEDRILLDLADLFLGAFRFGYLKPQLCDCVSDREVSKYNLSKVLKPLVYRLNEGYARMKNSRFEKYGTFSSAWIQNDQWEFENISLQFLKQKIPQNMLLPL